MTIRVAINGFGRMGRLVLRAGWGTDAYQLVHINEPFATAEVSAHLLAFDSVQGRWHDETISADGDDAIVVDGQRLAYTREADPAAIDWAALGVDLVLECTGKHRTPGSLQPYFEAGVAKVLVAAPVKQDALNVVYGINHNAYDPAEHRIVTAASCTTNCLAPVVKVVHEQFGIERGCITTIHDITNTQVLVDAPHKDLRRARAAGESLIPTTTGSATAITLIYPELKGRLDGHAVRVPLLGGSLTDAVFQLRDATTAEAVNAAFQAAADGELAGILGVEQRPLVSCDFAGDPRSSIIDAPSTMVTDGSLLKVYAWYDNEWGYVNRMHELCAHMCQLGW